MEKRKIEIGGEEFEVEIAGRISEKSRGLAGRAGLGERAGMLFRFSGVSFPIFWMRGMKFPIDIVWFRGRKIIGFAKNCPPARKWSETRIYFPPGLVDGALEIRAGTVERLELEVGQSVALPS